uniref:Uncharacterized protein n=1 Tax=Candidatus Methanogaster sp. ANME-2c ERB4 TaxID=2759911 RepID=A0A7G9Y2F6_9EURY|nr:hypothetical protein OONBJFFA_00005 [Methanosarcinales archaeon ANME-2c ERB4]QNO43167.1 hypothetical protein OODLAJBE_00009 [Methanosarcinales archaeon ANME-2c ERB4]QNO45367.1 hypothetical protein KKJLOPGH_00005 [Methanosarcinales archaeon ANME-2c ERB4]QNO45608.1 hypothetical protein JMABOEBK_00005 [Methanosarcinales archaeon ANME-2c ERB4]
MDSVVSNLCVFAPSRSSDLTQSRGDAKNIVTLSLHVFRIVVYPTDHYGNHWISRPCPSLIPPIKKAQFMPVSEYNHKITRISTRFLC